MDELRRRREQGCLTDCIAYYLNLHPDRVPLFTHPRKGWMRRVKQFFRRRGMLVFWVKDKRVPRRGMHIVCGDSSVWKRFAHVVVYRNGVLAYDPDYPSRWKDCRTTHRLIVIRRNNV